MPIPTCFWVQFVATPEGQFGPETLPVDRNTWVHRKRPGRSFKERSRCVIPVTVQVPPDDLDAYSCGEQR
jgi:hypothetical protein